MNKQIQNFYINLSLTPTTLTSVELFVFSFCLLDFQFTIPYPKYMQPPAWLFKSGCNPYTASTHVHNWLRLSATIVLVSYMVCYRCCNTCLNFSLSSLVILVTLVHRNDMAWSLLGFPSFATHSNFATMECRMSASYFSSLVEISYMFCRPFLSGDNNFAHISSPKKSIYSSM